jgi:hypothetical protein
MGADQKHHTGYSTRSRSRVKKMGTVEPILKGQVRQWVQCKECGKVWYYDYTPYGISSSWVSGCHFSLGGGMGFDKIRQITADEAMILISKEGK